MAKFQESLRVFFEVAECTSFTAAAKHLHLTQSAVSQQIKHLEEDLGVTLVDRTNRREIRLTPAGEITHEYVRKILQLEDELRRRIEDASRVVRGLLRIGASYTMGEYLLPMILTEFRNLYPEIQQEVEIYNTPAVIQGLTDKRLDVGLVESIVIQKGTLCVEELTQDELLVIVPSQHSAASLEQVDVRELAGETWIVREKGSGTREFTDHVLHSFGVEPHRVVAFSSTHSIKEAVRAGLGVALISAWALETERALKTLPVLRVSSTTLSRPLSLVTPQPGAMTPPAVLFADFVRRRLRRDARAIIS